MREIFVWEGGGAGCLQMGRVEIGRRRRNRGGEGRQSGHILTFPDGFTDGTSIGEPSVILTEQSTCHRTDLPFQIPRWFRRQFKRRTVHVAVRAVFLNPSVIPSEKITCQNLHVATRLFFTTDTISSVIQSVTTDGNLSSVVTDWITNRIVSVGNFDLKLPINIFHR